MRINSTHNFGSRGLDAYFTCPEAIRSLILLEGPRLPQRIWEPGAGDGAIVRELVASGRFVVPSDIYDYGLEGCCILDYLTAPRMTGVEGLVTNPPYRKALAFAEKAIAEFPYVALLVRMNFDGEGARRVGFRRRHPPTRIWKSARRLPSMHRYGWTGKRVSSNQGYWWLVWERGARREFPEDYDWKELLNPQLRLAEHNDMRRCASHCGISLRRPLGQSQALMNPELDDEEMRALLKARTSAAGGHWEQGDR